MDMGSVDTSEDVPQEDVTEEPVDDGETVDSLPNMPEIEDTPRLDDDGNEVAPQLPAEAPPAKTPVMPLLILLLILLIGTCITSLFAFHQSLQSAMPGVYAIFGMNQTDGLALADVIVRERPSRKRVRYVVEGNIVNESEELRDVPVLRVAIVGKDGEWLKSREYETEATLKPGESYAFKASKLDTAFQDKIDHLLIEIGNGVQLMLRQ